MHIKAEMNPLLTRLRSILLSFPLLFCVFLAWFYFGNHWYPLSTLTVKGKVSDVQSLIGIRWDSGHGLNGYEWERFQLQPFPDRHESEGISLSVTRTGVYNSASLGAKVILRNIFIDQKKFLPAGNDLPPGVELSDGALIFTGDGAEFRFTVKPQSSIQLEFPVANTMGTVDVRIGGKTTRTDLYAGNDERQWAGRNAKLIQHWFADEHGRFTLSMPMPRYGIRTLRIESKADLSDLSTTMSTDDGATHKLDGFVYAKGFNIPMTETSTLLKRTYHPQRFFFQILFALFSAWLASLLLNFSQRFQGVRDMFISRQRYIFSLMLLGSCLLFSFWHISFWPGITSNDSLEIWRAAQIPGIYLGDHPPLNVIFYLYLSQFWNDVAIVPLVQNFSTSLLIAFIFFTLFRKGLPLPCLIPLYALTALSLPVGLYTVVLWKDVPFALLVVLLGFKLACSYLDKQKKRLQISGKEWLSLFCLTLALVGFRHNGVIYLVIVPFIILLFGIVRIRPLVMAVLLTLVISLGALLFFFPGSSTTSTFLASQTKVYLNQAMKKVSFAYLKKCSNNYLSILDVNQKNMQWDLIHLCAYGRYTNDFLRNLRWNDVYPYLPTPSNPLKKTFEKAAWGLYWQSYAVPWVYFSWNPVYMLVLFPLLPLLYRWLPLASVFSLFILIPTAILVFLNILNWRYYFYVHLSSYFLIPLIITDCIVRKKRNESAP